MPCERRLSDLDRHRPELGNASTPRSDVILDRLSPYKDFKIMGTTLPTHRDREHPPHTHTQHEGKRATERI